jgi:hypothetical protein
MTSPKRDPAWLQAIAASKQIWQDRVQGTSNWTPCPMCLYARSVVHDPDESCTVCPLENEETSGCSELFLNWICNHKNMSVVEASTIAQECVGKLSTLQEEIEHGST